MTTPSGEVCGENFHTKLTSLQLRLGFAELGNTVPSHSLHIVLSTSQYQGVCSSVRDRTGIPDQGQY